MDKGKNKNPETLTNKDRVPGKNAGIKQWYVEFHIGYWMETV